eukprot:CAMPEP_0119053880 /NCGR_PEP_ID=MMETSP1177-20130426/74706_1 /TAXON_ID=2985 /ORGANISM="Ochromonas sp, Strain CCMP1899" /LENGTH=571 /DNA_ID=CAMNT_0007033949 /DNA_START=2547 /DNA_END=4262 /DNA_ORIENTATION=-
MSHAPAKVSGYPAPDMDPDSVWLDGFDHSVRAGSNIRSFLTVLSKALNAPPNRAWQSNQQYFEHMETSLTICVQKFGLASLIHLAERASMRLLQLYRDSGKIDKMVQEYAKISTSFKAISDGSTQFALGTFYSVLYLGFGVPQHLKGLEFIYRNANNLHVSEFQSYIKSHLQQLITSKNVEVIFLSGGKMNLDFYQTCKDACILMTSIQPIFKNKINLDKNKIILDNGYDNSMESTTLTNTFRYSVPFTLDQSKVHSRGVDLQWKRTTILSVKEDFPGVFSRQQVVSCVKRELSPIEVSLEDIQERVEIMQKELDLENASGVSLSGPDTSNLMRLIQGTVMPQVNAGAGEVARVFLNPNWSPPFPNITPPLPTLSTLTALPPLPTTPYRGHNTGVDNLSTGSDGSIEDGISMEDGENKREVLRIREKHEQDLASVKLRGLIHQMTLKVTLRDFLYLSKCLLLKSRRLLIDLPALLSPNSQDNENLMVRRNTSLSLIETAKNETAKNLNIEKNENEKNEKKVFSKNEKNVSSTSLSDYNLIWQKEMEKGYDNLIDSIIPLLGDVEGIQRLKR